MMMFEIFIIAANDYNNFGAQVTERRLRLLPAEK